MYNGEHTFIGGWGTSSVRVALVAAVLAALLYFLSEKRQGLRKSASLLYILHTLSLISASVALLVMIFGHYNEYLYVWKYSSRELSATYLLSSFWAGKEGSLLLWLLLQSLLGLALVFRRTSNARIPAVIAVVQAFMLLLLTGVDLGVLQLGQSPFVLLRVLPEYSAMPLFSDPDYLRVLTDGNGLNPLLHNPWMAIHPPVLFLGYAACLLPFAMAVATPRSAKADDSIPLFWPVLAVFCLGAGLILGGAWAYEDLTFGGFWSWDPVENASLVPWLLMLAALHFLLNREQRTSGRFLSAMPFVAALFAAYLTRSGVLSTTSVHSFSGDQGSRGWLILALLAFLVSLRCLPFRKNSHPIEPSLRPSSPSFWRMAGGFLLVLSAFQILFVTALPAFNTWFGLNLAPPRNSVSFYNQWQQGFAAGIALCMGISLYLPLYRITIKKVFIVFLPALLVGLVSTLVLVIFAPPIPPVRYFVLFCLFIAIFAMLDGMLRVCRQRSRLAASLSHLGFALFLTGSILTFSLEKPLGATRADNPKGLQTLVLGQVKPLGSGYVSYAGRSQSGPDVLYRLDFLYQAGDGKLYLDYTLYPRLTLSKDMGPLARPATRKTLREDVFVHLTYAALSAPETSPPPAGKSIDYIIVSARVFPWINLLWAGVIVMAVGLLLSLRKRLRSLSPDN